jgi:hypothetical protein
MPKKCPNCFQVKIWIRQSRSQKLKPFAKKQRRGEAFQNTRAQTDICTTFVMSFCPFDCASLEDQ